MKSLPLLVFFATLCTVFSEDCKQKCEPNTRFDDGCKSCICTAGGEIACTARICPPPPPTKEPPFECKPGTTFRRDCNTCTCNKDGASAICTEIACGVKVS